MTRETQLTAGEFYDGLREIDREPVQGLVLALHEHGFATIYATGSSLRDQKYSDIDFVIDVPEDSVRDELCANVRAAAEQTGYIPADASSHTYVWSEVETRHRLYSGPNLDVSVAVVDVSTSHEPFEFKPDTPRVLL